MHGTLDLTKRAATRRRSIKAGIIALAILAGIVAGAVLVYTPLGDQLLTFLGFTYPKSLTQNVIRIFRPLRGDGRACGRWR